MRIRAHSASPCHKLTLDYTVQCIRYVAQPNEIDSPSIHPPSLSCRSDVAISPHFDPSGSSSVDRRVERMYLQTATRSARTAIQGQRSMYAAAAASGGHPSSAGPRQAPTQGHQQPAGTDPKPQWRQPHPDHKPHRYRPTTKHAEEHVYVLTLRLSNSLHDTLNALRTKYFPPERLKVPAHLTLFHALPHSEMDAIVGTAQEVAERTPPFEVTTGRAFKLGKAGVAISPEQGTEQGAAVHAALRERWSDFLSKQDAKGFKAHWTVMNKVEDEEKVDAAFREVQDWTRERGASGQADGLVLWRYNHGRWEFEREFAFSSGAR